MIPITTRRAFPLALGSCASLFWIAGCCGWFDVAAPFRPAWLDSRPLAVALFVLAGACAAGWLWVERSAFPSDARRAAGAALWLCCGLALCFRLPLVRLASAGYLTADGALSGLLALRVGRGLEHFVFVPAVPYSGSLKAHLTAPLLAVLDPSRAFALVSALFFVLAVAAVCDLARSAAGERAALGAGLYLAFAPAFVTQYSLSNDGNYVEVLALGTWALALGVRWLGRADRPLAPPFAAGVLLGLAFWCHILALLHALALGLAVAFGVWSAARPARSRAALALVLVPAGCAVGYAPGLLWNLANGWASFAYVVPGLQPVGEGTARPLLERAAGLALDHAPILFGDLGGDAGRMDGIAHALAVAGALTFALGLVWAARAVRAKRSPALAVVLLFSILNLSVALLGLPYIPGNPRYLLFLAAPAAVLLASWLGAGRGRWLLAVLVAFGALGSWAQARVKAESDAGWRAFVRALAAAGVRHCYSDFYLATKINFLSEESIACSAKLGPTRTEYFFEYRELLERAPAAALIAVNSSQADKLGRRLERIGVTYERRDLMKPVLLNLSRKVDPEELFPDQQFPLR